MVTGRHANNPWLQELPDPVTKAVWENYAAVSPRFALENGLEDYDVIEINKKVSLPVLIQPGQAYKTISIALGYGRKNTGKVADNTGVSVFPLTTMASGNFQYSGTACHFCKNRSKTHGGPKPDIQCNGWQAYCT